MARYITQGEKWYWIPVTTLTVSFLLSAADETWWELKLTVGRESVGDREWTLFNNNIQADVIRLRWRQEPVKGRQGVAETVHGVVDGYSSNVVVRISFYSSV